MEKILYYFLKSIKAAVLMLCLMVVHSAFQELLSVGLGTGLHALGMCLAFAALGLSVVPPVVGLLGILEDIKAGV